jgi:Asp-tRNA(Asn)/Glu-tRNA(Gln) amidotransferase A subunit family amidase
MARSVNDLWLVLDSITPVRTDQEEVPPWRPSDPRLISVRDLRIALHTANGIFGPDADTIRTVLAASHTLESEGADIEERLPPEGGHDLTMEVWRSYEGEMPSRELYQVMRRWDALRVSFARFFGQYDAIVCPVFGTVAPPHDEENGCHGRQLHVALLPHRQSRRRGSLRNLTGSDADRCSGTRPSVERRHRPGHRRSSRGGDSAVGGRPRLVGNPGRFPADPGLA